MRSVHSGGNANDEFKRSYATSLAVGVIVAVAVHIAAFALLPSLGLS